ncbi:MAG: ABC transporter ATP-binding protein [Candidatus Sericytochromatia bacterium]|nr:ABC transporter ATP-binding protein [Candidatus Sericytochromatia bacterium]
MIKVSHLHYTYPKASTETLSDLGFEIAPGEIFGFLGPSGSGKSTTQKILMRLLKNYQGSIEVMGRELRDWGQDYYARIGVSFELPNHYLKLSALENLQFFGALYPDAAQVLDPLTVLDWVGLAADAHKSVRAFSKGMKIRLNLARSLLHQPRLLFLDEPTSGLDPVNASKVKDLILRLRSEGTTVFITTHDMLVADTLCDRVGFLTRGQLNVLDAPASLKKRYGQRQLDVEYRSQDQQLRHQTFALDDLGSNPDFLALLQSGQRLESLHSQETTLEKIFIEVTGEALQT